MNGVAVELCRFQSSFVVVLVRLCGFCVVGCSLLLSSPHTLVGRVSSFAFVLAVGFARCRCDDEVWEIR